MIKPKLRHLPLAAAAMVACMSAHADYQSPDGAFRLSGFGTIGAVKNGTDDALFNYPGQGGGASKKGSITPDSKIAVQGSYAFAPTFSATTQVMTKYDANGQYTPGLEWAFAKWQAAPSLMIRAGRMGAPYFMISDFRDVGYANLTTRPNLDVYGQVPVSQFEGADAAYQMEVGPATITSTLWYGDSKAKFASSLVKTPVNVDIKRQLGLNIQADLGNGFTFRAGRVVGKLSLASDLGTQLTNGAAALQAGLQSYASNTSLYMAGVNNYAAGAAQEAAGLQALVTANPGLASTLNPKIAEYTADAATANAAATSAAAAIASANAAKSSLDNMSDLVDPTNKLATFTGLGMSYDEGNWVANVEYTTRKTNTFVSDTHGMYGTIGYRVGKFTPYFGLSKLITTRRTDNPVVPSSLGARGTVATTHSAVADYGCGAQCTALANGPTALTAGAAQINAGAAGLNAPTAGPTADAGTAALNAGVGGVLGVQKLDERTTTLGVRWDAKTNLAVKAQWDRVNKPADSGGMFLIPDPTQTAAQSFMNSSRSVNVFSVSVDFVF